MRAGWYLSAEDLRVILRLHEDGVTQREIARMTGRSRGLVRKAINGKTPTPKRVKHDWDRCDGCGGPLPCVECAREAAARRTSAVAEISDLELEIALSPDLDESMLERMKEVREQNLRRRGVRHYAV